MGGGVARLPSLFGNIKRGGVILMDDVTVPIVLP